MSERYQPFYCEENAWWLCRERLAQPCGVLFISNPAKQVALWQQRLGDPVIWDYHVVALSLTRGGVIHDWDTRLSDDIDRGVPLATYLEHTFAALSEEHKSYRPLFRWVASPQLMQSFSSDRRHMRREGHWLQPPPPWPCLVGTDNSAIHNLERFIDMRDDIAGMLMTQDELLDWAHSTLSS